MTYGQRKHVHVINAQIYMIWVPITDSLLEKSTGQYVST